MGGGEWRGVGETMAMPASSAVQDSSRDATVRVLAWRALRDSFEARVGVAEWAVLVNEVEGPDLAVVDDLDNVALESFVRALDALDAQLGSGDGTVIDEAGVHVTAAWARENRGIVRNLAGDPARLLDLFATEAFPFLLDSNTASEWISSTGNTAVLDVNAALPERFTRALLKSAAELARCDASVTARGTQFVVAWTFRGVRPRPNVLDAVLLAARVPFLTATLAPVLVGSAVAWAGAPAGFDWGVFALALAGAVLVHVGTNTANDYFDHKSGADRATPVPGPFSGGNRVIQRGIMAPRAVATIAATAFTVGAGIGLYLVWTRGIDLLWVGVGGLLLALLYTMPPVNLASRGLGEFAVALGLGPIVVLGAAFVQTGAYSWTAFAASVPLAALIAAVLFLNEFPDFRGDRSAGKRTLVVRLGPERARAGYYGLLALGFVSVPVAVSLGALPATTLIVLASLPLAWLAHKVFKVHYRDPFKLAPASVYTVLLHSAVGALLFAGFIASRWYP